MNSNLIFLKLGGSLITDKNVSHLAKTKMIEQIAKEIQSAISLNPSMQLLVGHGSGSFGHVPAKQNHTRQGVNTPEEWVGFSQVWSEARALNQIVLDRFARTGISAVSFPPSASIRSKGRQIQEWNLYPIEQALSHHLTPVVYGDVIFDSELGGTILSTEELFVYLANQLHPARLLITGEEQGVWEDFPTCQKLISQITPEEYPHIENKIFGSQSTDVTGGMASKVALMVNLVKIERSLEVQIFSPSKPGMLAEALTGCHYGTMIKA